MEKEKDYPLTVKILGVLMTALIYAVIGFLIMLLWNWLMPLIFELPQISYWESVGLMVLFSLLTSCKVNIA